MTFLEIDYTGTADGAVFDTTRKADAPGRSETFAPVIVKLGIGILPRGLDTFLQGKGTGDYTVDLQPEDAFGKKDAKKLRLMPIKAFGKDAKQLTPGLPVTVGESQGVVKSVSGGRVVVDFNHPLAGKAVQYAVTVRRVVEDKREQVDAMLRFMLGAKVPVSQDGDQVVVSLPKGFPAEGLVKELEKQTGATVSVKEIEIDKQKPAA